MTYEVLDVTATRGIARWSAHFERLPTRIQAHLEGVLIAEFRTGAKQAHAFQEWWHTQEAVPQHPVALITGASRGLGATLAAFLAGQGYALILTARGAGALQTVAEGLAQYDVPVIVLPGDIADAEHRARLVAAAKPFGGIDVLVNNASVLGPSPLLTLAEFPLVALRNVFEVNVMAPLALVQSALPLLTARQGLVINLSSDAAVGGYESWGGYGASKAALDLISSTLANELREAGVSVVSVDPGDMRTVMHQQAFPGEEISDRPLPDVTLPFWAWMLGQDRATISGQRFQAQAEQWEAVTS